MPYHNLSIIERQSLIRPPNKYSGFRNTSRKQIEISAPNSYSLRAEKSINKQINHKTKLPYLVRKDGRLPYMILQGYYENNWNHRFQGAHCGLSHDQCFLHTISRDGVELDS